MTLTHRVLIAFATLLTIAGIAIGGLWIGYAHADDGSGSAVATGSAAVESVPAPTPAPLPDVEPSQVLKLWQSGAFLGAGALTLFLLLTFALKLDSKRAFYYTAGLTGMAGIVDLVAAGHRLTWSAVIVALTTIASIVAKGPRLGRS